VKTVDGGSAAGKPSSIVRGYGHGRFPYHQESLLLFKAQCRPFVLKIRLRQ
jgi:hypothetical protein